MPTTTPDNIYYADSSTAMSAETISAAEATSVQAALDGLINNNRQVQTYIWANAAARTAQTGMLEGAIGYQSDTDVYYSYTGAAWVLLVPTSRIIPSAATNGSVSATGVVTSTAQSLVRVRDAFPAGFTAFQVDYDITTSGATGVNARLAVNATDATTAYDNQRFTIVNATATAVQALNAGELQFDSIGLAARRVGRMVLHDPNVATQTLWFNDGLVTANPMTTSAGSLKNVGQHRTGTAYNSISFIAPSGTITINRLTVRGLA